MCAAEDNQIYCFANATGKLEHSMKVSARLLLKLFPLVVLRIIFPDVSWAFSAVLFSVECGLWRAQIHDNDVIGLAHHPNYNVVVSWGFDGCMNILKP